MRITVVPSSTGACPEHSRSIDQHLSSFLVNDRIAIDAGSIGFYRDAQAQANIRHVFITHSHIDHIASLPILLDNVVGLVDPCVTVHASAEVLDCLQRDVFNDRLWPDFIKLSKPGFEFLRVSTLEPFVPVDVEGLRITPIPVDHVVPNLGLILEEGPVAIAIPSDTGPTEQFWKHAKQVASLKAVFLEASFPNEMEWLAQASKHLTPRQFGEEVRKLGRPDVHWYAVHLKARYRETLERELAELGIANFSPARFGHEYNF